MPKQANNEMNLYISFYAYTLGIIPLFHLIGFELSTPVQTGDYYSSLLNYHRIIAMRKISHEWIFTKDQHINMTKLHVR